MTRQEFENKMRKMATKAGDELHKEGMGLFDKMTSDETKPYDDQDFRLAKIILCAVANSEVITNQFAAECVLRDIRRVKRIRAMRT